METAKAGSDHTRAVRGHPGSVLAELGTHAGLLVVGGRGLDGFTGLLLHPHTGRPEHTPSRPHQ